MVLTKFARSCLQHLLLCYNKHMSGILSKTIIISAAGDSLSYQTESEGGRNWEIGRRNLPKHVNVRRDTTSFNSLNGRTVDLQLIEAHVTFLFYVITDIGGEAVRYFKWRTYHGAHLWEASVPLPLEALPSK